VQPNKLAPPTSPPPPTPTPERPPTKKSPLSGHSKESTEGTVQPREATPQNNTDLGARNPSHEAKNPSHDASSKIASSEPRAQESKERAPKVRARKILHLDQLINEESLLAGALSSTDPDRYLDRMGEEGLDQVVCPDGVMRGLFDSWDEQTDAKQVLATKERLSHKLPGTLRNLTSMHSKPTRTQKRKSKRFEPSSSSVAEERGKSHTTSRVIRPYTDELEKSSEWPLAYFYNRNGELVWKGKFAIGDYKATLVDIGKHKIDLFKGHLVYRTVTGGRLDRFFQPKKRRKVQASKEAPKAYAKASRPRPPKA
jgi:hypothetical protein